MDGWRLVKWGVLAKEKLRGYRRDLYTRVVESLEAHLWMTANEHHRHRKLLSSSSLLDIIS